MKKIFTFLLLCFALNSFSQVRISQVYGGGGNTAATYNQDFVELFNAGATSADISGYSVQYASAAGTAWQTAVIPAGTTMAPGSYYLIALATSTVGAALPTPNLTAGINMSGSTGKVALVNTGTALVGASACADASVVDVIGFGTGSCFETAVFPTTGISNALSIQRLANGCTDNNNNSTDFTLLAVNPRNSSSTLNPCGPVGPTIVAGSNITNLTTSVGMASAQTSYTLSAISLTPLTGNITITASAGLEISLTSGGPYVTTPIVVPYVGGVLANTIVYVRISASATQGQFTGSIDNSGGGATTVTVTVNGSVVQNYYNTKANLGLTNVGTWSSTPDGSGTSPVNFTSPYQYFNIVNQANVDYAGVWDVTGTDSKVIVGDGSTTLTFEIKPGADSVTSATKIDVLNNGLLSIYNNRIPTLNVLATGSTVNFNQFGTTTADTIKIPAISYYNLYLTSGLKYFSGLTTTVRGNLYADQVVGMNGNSSSPFSTLNVFGNVDFANGSKFDLLPGGDAGRLTLKMNGPGPTQQINADGNDISLFRLQRDSSAANTILLGLNTGLTLGNNSGGGLQLNPFASTLALGANTLTFIGAANAGTSATTGQGKISATGGNINVLKSLGTGDAGTLRFHAGATLTSFTLNLGLAVTKDSVTIADNLTSAAVNLVRGKIVMTTGDTLSANIMSAPTVTPYSFVDGAVRLTGTANLGFAVGRGNNFAPVGISNFGGTPQTYVVEYFNAGYGNYTIDPATLATYPAYEVSRSLHWRVNSNNPAPYDAVFGYTDASARILVPNLIRMANFDNTDWSDRGGFPNPANTTIGGTVSVPALTVFGPFTFAATAGGIIPVRLSSFAAQKAGTVTRVIWTTEQEINSKEFAVERSIDGGRTWTTVAAIPAAGNSSLKRQYSVVDNSPAQGVNLYRLRSVDVDNRFTNSEIKAVLFGRLDAVLVTPNPASSYVNIYMSKNDNSLSHIIITDANGRLVEKISTADQTHQVNVSRYAKGMYVIKVLGAENTSTQKVIIQ